MHAFYAKRYERELYQLASVAYISHVKASPACRIFLRNLIIYKYNITEKNMFIKV